MKILNRIFAASGLVLVIVVAWSIRHDHHRAWRDLQQHARTWDAALTAERISRSLGVGQRSKLAEFRALSSKLNDALTSGKIDFAALAKEVGRLHDSYGSQHLLTDHESQLLTGLRSALLTPPRQEQFLHYHDLSSQITRLQGEYDSITFTTNNLRSNLAVQEAALEQALITGDHAGADALQKDLEAPRQKVQQSTMRLAQMHDEIERLKRQRDQSTREVDNLRRLAARLGASVDMLKRKLQALDPEQIPGAAQRLAARSSEAVRDLPLLEWINPTERIRQVSPPDVLADLSYAHAPVTDRCITCHVNIDRPEFAESRVIAYLEEQCATGRGVRFIASERADFPTESAPGPAAMPEFWHNWGVRLAPAAVRSASRQLRAIASSVNPGKGVNVSVNGELLTGFAYDRVKLDEPEQNRILSALLKAWLAYAPTAGEPYAARSSVGNVTVQIALDADPALAHATRQAAFTYLSDLRRDLEAALNADELRLLRQRYRYALIAEVNVYRRQRGYAALDPSPVMLAHPRLDLYASADSPHSVDAVGCTACHDGSGQETDFVLAAHVSRGTWVDAATGTPVLPEQMLHADGQSSSREAGIHDFANVRKSALAAGCDSLSMAGAQRTGDEPPAPARSLQYLDPASGATGEAVSQLDFWKSRYEKPSGTTFQTVYHMWDWPMRPGRAIESNCARCHEQISDIREEAPTLATGRALFVRNCGNCHQLDAIPLAQRQQKIGPDLRHVNEKLSTAFLDSWIWAPKAFRPSTRMPHYFMLENNSSDEELRRTLQEVRAMASYLQETSTPSSSTPTLADTANREPTLGNMEQRIARGRVLFLGMDGTDPVADKQGGVGCIACHTNLNETGYRWIVNDLQKSGRLADELTTRLGHIPSTSELHKAARDRYEAMSYNQRQWYAMEHFPEPALAGRPPTYPDGSERPVFQRFGPELSNLGDKLLADRSQPDALRWLYRWLMDPRGYCPGTIMPRMRLTPEQAMDLACYLLDQRRTTRDKDDTWKPVAIAPDPDKLTFLVAQFLLSQYDQATAIMKAGDSAELTRLASSVLRSCGWTPAQIQLRVQTMDRQRKQSLYLGQRLLNHYGCANCHKINGLTSGSSSCPDLSTWGQVRLERLDFGKLQPEQVAEFHQDPAARRLDIKLVNGLSTKAVTEIIPRANAGQWRQPIAGDVSAEWPRLQSSRASWLAQKLRDPRVFNRGRALLDPLRAGFTQSHDAKGNVRDVPVISKDQPGRPYVKLRMPCFYLDDSQVEAISTFVLSNRERLISARMLAKVNSPEAQTLAAGRQMLESHNCGGCHEVEDNSPAIQQYWQRNIGYFARDDIPSRAPPPLWGEGARVQHNWLFEFLRHVETGGTGPRGRIRPMVFIRMPSFALTELQTTSLDAYFSAEATRQSRLLQQRVDLVLRDLVPSSADVESTADAANLWPPEGWYLDQRYTAAAAFLRDFAIRRTGLREADFSPAASSEAQSRAYDNALFDARVIANAFRNQYPFEPAPSLATSDDRFHKGELLLHFAQCQTCHVVGDETSPKVNPAPRGPNLALAFRRIRRDWARLWIQEPQLIHPNGAMPAIFFSGRSVPSLTDPGKTIFSVWGLPHLTANPTPQIVRQLQYNFGQTAQEQIDLLLDFIYAAGARGYTSPDPPLNAPLPLATPPASFVAMPIPGFTGAGSGPATQPAATQPGAATR